MAEVHSRTMMYVQYDLSTDGTYYYLQISILFSFMNSETGYCVIENNNVKTLTKVKFAVF